jgi:hypothetical protein
MQQYYFSMLTEAGPTKNSTRLMIILKKISKKSVAVLSIILTVFAIGTQYAYLDSPHQNAASHGASGNSEDELGTMFHRQAIRFLPEIIEADSVLPWSTRETVFGGRRTHWRGYYSWSMYNAGVLISK